MVFSGCPALRGIAPCWSASATSSLIRCMRLRSAPTPRTNSLPDERTYAMNRSTIVLAAFAASLALGVAQAQTTAPKAAAAPQATGKALYSQAMFDTLLKQRTSQGQPDTPELRNSIREELNTRDLLAREAKKANLDKNPETKNQMDLASQTVLVSVYVADWIKKNPIPEAD